MSFFHAIFLIYTKLDSIWSTWFTLCSYLSTWFALDVASTVPFGAIAFIFTGKYGKGFTYSLINMLRLWRLRRVSALFARYILTFARNTPYT